MTTQGHVRIPSQKLSPAGECDDAFFDASRKRIYVIGGAGFISVFQQDDPAHYSLIQDVPSAIGVRTGFWFAKRDRLYVAVPAKGKRSGANMDVGSGGLARTPVEWLY